MTTEEGAQRPEMGQAGQGISVGEEQRYSQGLPVGTLLHRLGSRESVVRDMPGWFVADGTQPHFVLDGVDYGAPDMRGKFPIGADGSSFLPGLGGGSNHHNHPFTHEAAHAITQPTAHVITQPVFAAPTAHTITQPVVGNHAAFATHFHLLPMAKDGAGTGIIYLPAPSTYGSSATAISAQSRIATTADTTANLSLQRSEAVSAGTPDAHTLSTNVGLSNNHDAPARTTDVALTHNHDGVALSNNSPHSGGAVEDATGDNRYPPYVAFWPIIKIYG